MPFTHKLRTVAPVRLIVCSFFLVIFIGTLLLMTPWAAKSGESTPFINALFTSTSATCVTGLVVYDTWSHFTIFGQLVIILLIQVGGLGVVSFTSALTILMRRKLGLRDLQLATESSAGNNLNIYQLIRVIIGFTFSCEFIGMLLLSIRFIPKFGFAHGLGVSAFEAVSAYCNAGFDILGFEKVNGSITNYAEDPLVCMTIAALTIIGGIGFIVITDIFRNKVEPRLHKRKATHLGLHSMVALRFTAVLLVLGTLLFFAFEYGNTLSGLSFGGKLNASFFQSASARTAGFASIDIAAEHDITKLTTVILMFIGASPGSTGGGIKTTTFMVLFATVVSVIRGQEDTILHHRRIDRFTVYRSLAILSGAFVLVLITTGIILATNDASVVGIDALFEATSAFGTVGLTAGLTPILSTASKAVLCLTMFIGRVGPVSLAVALMLRKGRHASIVLPEGKIVVG